MAYTAAQINAIYQAVLQRPADVAAIQTYAGSSNSDIQVRTQIETSQEANTNVNPVIRLYQGALGRLPDNAGLSANVATYINGYNSTALAQSFLASPEAAAIYGSTSPTVNSGFVTTVYQNALNRTASTSEVSYWVGTGKSAAQVLNEISMSSEAMQKEATPILTFLDSQATSTTALGGSGMSSLTGSEYNQIATNFTFTNGQDTIVGSQNSDMFAATVATLQANDSINGYGGLNTLNIGGNAVLNQANLPTAISNVQVINFTGNGAQNIDLSGVNGLSLATVRGGTASNTITLKSGEVGGIDGVTTGGVTETFNFGTGTSGSLAVANGTGSTAGATVTAAVNGANLSTINVLSTGSTGVNTANTITLTSNSTNEKVLNLSGDKALNLTTAINTLTTIDATAESAGVKFTATAAETALTSARFGAGNDSFLTGDTFAAGSAANTATIDGGTGLNYLGVNTASLATLTSGATTPANKISNFQVVEVQDAFNGASNTYDISKIAGASSLQFDNTVTGTATVFNNLSSGGSIAFKDNVTTGSAAALTFNVANALSNASDTETFFLNKNVAAVGTHTIGAFTLQGVENVVLNVRDLGAADNSGFTTLTGITDNQLTSITLQSTAVDATGAATKAANLVLGNGYTSNVINSIDASGFNANVDASGVTLISTGATVKGGAGELYSVGGTGNDTVTVGTGGGLINGGTGTDSINLAAATTANVAVTQAGVNGGNAQNVLDVVQNTTGQNATVASADSVSGFHLGATAGVSDVLAFNGTAAATNGTGTFASANATVVAGNVASSSAGQAAGSNVTVSITNGVATVTNATGTAAVTALQNYLNTTAANTAAGVVVGSDTYVVHTGAATANTADDAVVKLVGVSNETAISTTAFGATTIHLA